MLLNQTQIRISGHATVEEIAGGWRLRIPAGKAGVYRLAQLDDYADLARRAFPWGPPLRFGLRARASSKISPGTWGFGLWNDPFGLSLGFGGGQRTPALPNAAWFFFASPENHLSLRDDLPGNGAFAASYRAKLASYALIPFTLPALPLLFWRPSAKVLRRLVSQFFPQDAVSLSVDPLEWHHYTLSWEVERVGFAVDGEEVMDTAISPRPPLGLVLWLDNQYAAWRPDGGLAYGTLASSREHWLEIRDLRISH